MGIYDPQLKMTNLPGGLSVTELADAKLAGNAKHTVLKAITKRFKFGDGTTETDLGFDLPAYAVVDEVLIDVITAEATGATKTLDIGLLSSESGGDADGFLDGVSVSSTGLKRAAVTVTTGANNTYLASTTHGALMRDFVAGEDVANGGDGAINVRGHLTSSVTAKSVSVTPGSNDFAELVADIIILYRVVEARVL